MVHQYKHASKTLYLIIYTYLVIYVYTFMCITNAHKIYSRLLYKYKNFLNFWTLLHETNPYTLYVLLNTKITEHSFIYWFRMHLLLWDFSANPYQITAYKTDRYDRSIPANWSPLITRCISGSDTPMIDLHKLNEDYTWNTYEHGHTVTMVQI